MSEFLVVLLILLVVGQWWWRWKRCQRRIPGGEGRRVD
jgi:hypothetical protein